MADQHGDIAQAVQQVRGGASDVLEQLAFLNSGSRTFDPEALIVAGEEIVRGARKMAEWSVDA